MKWVLSILFLVAVSLVFAPIGEAFRACPWPFVALWLLIPVGMTALRYSKAGFRRIRKNTAKRIYEIAFMLMFALSFIVFVNFNFFRDRLGSRYISGYDSYYYPDVDEYGRPTTAVDVEIDYWSDRLFLWGFEVVYLVACIGLPILTWKAGKYLVDYAIDPSAAGGNANRQRRTS